MMANGRGRTLCWTLLALAAWAPQLACSRSHKNRPRVHVQESSTRPRAELFSQINGSPAGQAVEKPETPTRTAADDLPCDTTTTWMRAVLPEEETPADWERPLDKWTRERALGLLLANERVRGPAVGPKGRVPPEVWAMMTLTKQRDLTCAAVWLLKRAQLPGRIYALAALWLADRPNFALLAVDYNDLPAPVAVTFGLVDGQVRAADLMTRIRTGELPEAWQAATEPLSAEDEP